MDTVTKAIGGITYSSYCTENRSGEQFIADHAVGYILSGSITIIDGSRTHVFRDGDVVLFRRNHLAKFIKRPPSGGGELLVISLLLDQSLLQGLAKGRSSAFPGLIPPEAVLQIRPDELLQHYLDALPDFASQEIDAELAGHKIQEFVLLLLRAQPELQQVLFDFGTPGKIDLEAFMQRNFRYNVPLEKLAFLTGRSLATFKRDFEKIFHCPPSRWLLEQRLKEAYYLISNKNVKPSAVYLYVGFESLSHFSHAFKRSYGMRPSRLAAGIGTN
ncbi:AraC family transcriptional regulator [Mucilaginibacter sp.]|uniref:helix-turn-helix domain-containing protein n=1 Tax=Mucilaginibacter sp. TaxID=1882438 RepID=UPI00260D60A8|nr:AraC family transcriptional regulator [Mucilaginibacter sp.]MDB4920516.1 AraC family transcriptional regulator [Mucilaginibacter sp.]